MPGARHVEFVEYNTGSIGYPARQDKKTQLDGRNSAFGTYVVGSQMGTVFDRS